MLTSKQKKNYIKHGYAGCPHCKSSNVTCSNPDMDGSTVITISECSSCGKYWKDIYTLTGVEELMEV